MNKRNIYRSFLAAALVLAVSCAGYTEKAKADEPDEIYTYNRGDINLDGKVNVFDCIRYQKLIINNKPYEIDRNYINDINGDGRIDSSDMILLKKHLLGDEKIVSLNDLPVMDGSTSAIPLEAGFKSQLMGLPYYKARQLVQHNKTHESFSRLLSGENDLIFSVPISESQEEAAREAGVHLNKVPVAKESFVFVVNKDNPVDTLTQQQIRDIYSGKITNWKEVGGNDEKIIPYQRNKDSGSQNYMIEFMKDDVLMDAPLDYIVKVMGGLMDRIAIYDNSSAAIGYSVYSYAAQMYENSADVKFIAVDGVKPSRETIADSSYPLVSHTYIMYRDDASQKTRDFIDWAVSEEGQVCAMKNGYLPVEDIEYPDNYKLYNSCGTGKEMPENYAPSQKYSSFNISKNNLDISKPDTYLINFLKDKKFESQINADILAVLPELKDKSYLSVNYYGLNGYMSININEKYLNYDLINQKKIEKFSDLFYKDTCFINEVNQSAAEYLSHFITMRTEFLGITGEPESFSLEDVNMSSDNPYTDESERIYYSNNRNILKYMVTGEFFDMREVVSIFDTGSFRTGYYPDWETKYIQNEDGYICSEIIGSLFHTKEETDKQAAIYRKMYKDAIAEAEKRGAADRIENVHVIEYDGSYFMRNTGYKLNLYMVSLDDYGFVSDFCKYSPETGERVTPEDVFGKSALCIKNFSNIVRVDTEYNLIFYSDGKNENGENHVVRISYNPDEVNNSYLVAVNDKNTIWYETEDFDFHGRICTFSTSANRYTIDENEMNMRITDKVKTGTRVNVTGRLMTISAYSSQLYYECCDAVSGKYYGYVSAEDFIETDPDDPDVKLKDSIIDGYLNVLNSYSMFDRELLYDVNNDGITELIVQPEYSDELIVYSYNETDGVYTAAEIPVKYYSSQIADIYGVYYKYDMYTSLKDKSLVIKTGSPSGYKLYRFVSRDGKLTAESSDYKKSDSVGFDSHSICGDVWSLGSKELIKYFEGIDY